MNKENLTRRAFLTVAGAGTVFTSHAVRANTAQVVPGRVSPNERLNIAAIGIGGMGRANIDACATDMFEAVEQSYQYLTQHQLAKGNK